MVPITCNAVGDILALAELVIDVVRALNDARGAPAEYRAFNQELNSLHAILLTATRIAKNTDDPVLREEIIRNVDQCGRDVQASLARVADLSALSDDAGSTSGMRDRFRRNRYKLVWRFKHRDEAQTFRQELATATQRLTMLFVLSHTNGAVSFRTNVLNKMDALVSQHGDLSDTIHRHTVLAIRRRNTPHRHDGLVRDLYECLPEGVDSQVAVIAVLCAAICAMGPYDQVTPKALLLVLIYLLSRSSGKRDHALALDVAYSEINSVTLLDALGRKLTLPFELCGTYEMFHSTLVNLFAQTNGRWFIDSRRYTLRLLLSPHPSIYEITQRLYPIDAINWASIVIPGSKLEMAVLVMQAPSQSEETLLSSSVGELTCPICPVQTLSRHNVAYWNEYFACITCGRRFNKGTKGRMFREHGTTILSGSTSSASNAIDFSADRGRYPRSIRPMRPSHILPSSVDDGQPPRIPLRWETQVQTFTRIDIHESWPWSSFSPGYYSVETSPQDHRGFLTAAQNGHHALVSTLIDEGVDVNATSKSGYTALHLAALDGHVETIELLLSRGAFIDAIARYNVTPLASATMSDQHEAAAILLARGAAVDASMSARSIILHIAAMVGNTAVLQSMIHLGVDVNTPLDMSECGGDTSALDKALLFSLSSDTVRVLLQHGADASLPHSDSASSTTGDGFSTLSFAMSPSRPDGDSTIALDVAEMLFEWIMERDQMWHSKVDPEEMMMWLSRAICCNRPKLINIILDTGVDVNAHFDDGETPLVQAAAQWGQVEPVALLLARGGDPNGDSMPPSRMKLTQEGSWKALHAASYNSTAEVVDILLRHGVDMNVQSECGLTPLSYALERLSERIWDVFHEQLLQRQEVVRLLLSRGGVVYDALSSSRLDNFLATGDVPRTPSDPHHDMVVPGAWCEDVE
ncbi:unnamed protein product [Peniophora sp. CBMAI 1063]|nr:unnamed protein product [Peniophora sp. CBMAI 1063]